MRHNATLGEARRIAAGATLVVVPCDPQPIREDHSDVYDPRFPMWKLRHGWGNALAMAAQLEKDCPARVGDVLECAEPFLIDVADIGPSVYFQCEDEHTTPWPNPPWSPANTMPAWAIRHRRPIVSITAKRLGEIDTLDALAMRFEGRLVEGVLKEAGKPERRGTFADGDPLDEFREAFPADHGREWDAELWCFVYVIKKGGD